MGIFNSRELLKDLYRTGSAKTVIESLAERPDSFMQVKDDAEAEEFRQALVDAGFVDAAHATVSVDQDTGLMYFDVPSHYLGSIGQLRMIYREVTGS